MTVGGVTRVPRWRVPGRLLAGPVVACLLAGACTAPAPGPPPSSPAPPTGSTGAPPTAPTGGGPGGFVALADVDPSIVEEIRYQTDHNFVGRPVAGYDQPICLLTRAAADALRRAQTAARSRGYGLKVYDCYRPQRAVDDFVAWANRPDEQETRAEFYPRVPKSRLFAEGYLGSPTAHSRGSTVDLTLVAVPVRQQRPYQAGEPLTSCTAPQAARFPDNTVDMGTGFDCFDPLSHTLDSRITGPARQNRLLLRQLMTDAGFSNYRREWWHYTLDGAPHPDTYFDFPVTRGVLRS